MATMAAELKLEPSREVDVEQDHRSWRTVPPTSSIGSLRPRPHVRGWAKGVLWPLFCFKTFDVEAIGLCSKLCFNTVSTLRLFQIARCTCISASAPELIFLAARRPLQPSDRFSTLSRRQGP